MNLENKVIAITGSGQGLGRAMAVELAKKGAHIAVIDMNEEHMAETVAMVRELGVKAESYACNVSKEDQVEQTFNSIVDKFGSLSGLVNNAGITRDGMTVKMKDGQISKMSLDQWQTVIDVDLTGVFLCGREAAVHMIKAGEAGCIINISSISRAGNLGQPNYSAAKAGVAALATEWAKEFARYGIRANAIAPGFIKTEMTSAMPEAVLEKIAAGIPLKRMGQPEDIAMTVAFIMENDYISGRVVEIDGGLRI